MSSAARLPVSAAGLNDRELAVLRLLASGHTAKSIAAQLGCSEAAINERLREARRKTGTGSSRELARRLAAQKIWDENIDLGTPEVAVQGWSRPETIGSDWSKGTLVMLISLTMAALGYAATTVSSVEQAATAPSAVATAGPMPLEGTWSLDVARIPEDERPRRVTITFRASADRTWTTLVDIVAGDGSIAHAESRATVGGAPVPVVSSLKIADTVALRQPAAGTLVMTLGRAGTPVSTRVYTVAPDRKSMTETIIWAGSEIPKLETTYFNRVD
ncbi:helix-turn-helix transcriptional regulator [Sphingomonas sp. SUN039]|uniref:helix-turn-helix domain-containing protein n=1 Tax=Sphingomonas sp. SUN039 TaxID=2937787 RepID=UPI0021642F2C|nr:helix-turn-helix transcriptional regulator [Sphingomonas sp. SUN039]UVO55569.1 helix-turn-helix transcriptional regulator [Sphingomonas sp. SUN039]